MPVNIELPDEIADRICEIVAQRRPSGLDLAEIADHISGMIDYERSSGGAAGVVWQQFDYTGMSIQGASYDQLVIDEVAAMDDLPEFDPGSPPWYTRFISDERVDRGVMTPSELRRAYHNLVNNIAGIESNPPPEGVVEVEEICGTQHPSRRTVCRLAPNHRGRHDDDPQ